MTPEQAAARLHARLQTLADVLQRDEGVLALLGLGSVGVETVRIDAASDLDFFVLTRPGHKWRHIDNLAWLHAADPAGQLAWHFRNTVDGHKALMSDGMYCEFAVFEVQELPGIPYSPGRWVWRRDEVPEHLAQPERALPRPSERAWLVGEALSNLLVGVMRHARGEKLAAMRLVQVYALDRVLELMELDAGMADAPSVLPRDPFNVDRRVEARLPAALPLLPQAAAGWSCTPQAALALLQALQARAEVPAALAQQIQQWADTALSDSVQQRGG